MILGLVTYYLTLFLSYRPYDIDNPWFLSFSYNTCVEHLQTDRFLNARFPAGMDGTQYFGKIAAYTQCAVLSHTAWQQWPAIALSAALVGLALILWWLLLEKLGYSSRLIAVFLLIAGLSEPFVSAANKARYESLSFALTSLGLLLVISGKPLLGSLIAGLALESEPFAIAGLIPLLILAFSRKEPLSLRGRHVLPRVAAGLAIAALLYFALHPHISSILKRLQEIPTNAPLFSGGFFAAYFFQRLRHLPELAFFLIAAAVYWSRRKTFPSHDLAWCSAVLALFAIATPHGNAAYMIFAYPFFVMTALLAFNVDRRPWPVIAVALLLFLPQQFALVLLNRNLGLRYADVRQVTEAIDTTARQQGLSPDTLRVYGDYRLWFAHPHLFRAASYGTVQYIRDADLYLCYDQPPQPLEFEPQYLLYCGDLRRFASLRLLETLVVRGNLLSLYAKR